MHNCRETREQIIELLLDGADCRSDEALSAELRKCAECRNEFDALKATLRITTRTSELSAPGEDYWTTYHAKLRQKLVSVNTPGESHGPSLVARFFRLTVPVPLPLAIALVVAAALFLSFAIHGARKDIQPKIETTYVRVPVEVPVVQEKIVTRVVYRERRPLARTSKRITDATKGEGTFAKTQKPDVFAGFKPSEEVKLTVIKGGSANEK